MEKKLILVAGRPGTGKTWLANYLSEKLGIVLICKDKLKEIIWDKIRYDTKIRSESQKYGGLAYDLSFHFCDMIMATGNSVIFESNFVEPGSELLRPYVEKYGYKVITIMLDGDTEIIHKRFMDREVTDERHPGLISYNHFSDYEAFKRATQPCRDFDYGDIKILVDITDFSKVDYEGLAEQVLRA